MSITHLKVGDPVAWDDLGVSFQGTVSQVRKSSHFGEDRIDVDVDQDDGSVWSFNDDYPGTLRLVEAVSNFENQVRATLEALGEMLIEKNKAYGDSALNPVRIFSKADPVEQIMVRIDDKLSRLARGSEYAGDDTVTDLLGYLVLLKIARDGQSNAVPDAQ